MAHSSARYVTLVSSCVVIHPLVLLYQWHPPSPSSLSFPPDPSSVSSCSMPALTTSHLYYSLYKIEIIIMLFTSSWLVVKTKQDDPQSRSSLSLWTMVDRYFIAPLKRCKKLFVKLYRNRTPHIFKSNLSMRVPSAYTTSFYSFSGDRITSEAKVHNFNTTNNPNTTSRLQHLLSLRSALFHIPQAATLEVELAATLEVGLAATSR